MIRGRIIVDAMWDEEACVFVATSRDVPGLVAEAPSMEVLYAKLYVLVPELLELNAEPDDNGPEETELVVTAEKTTRLRLHA